MRARQSIPPFLLLIALACGAPGEGDLAWRTTVDTLGDTIVVRTTGAESPPRHGIVTEMEIGELEGADEYTFGSVVDVVVTPEGDLYVYDSQAMQIRRYDARGTFVRNVGRKGGGPGEYDRLNGVDLGPDGRLYIWDAGNARISMYTPHGEPDGSWRVQGGFFTSDALAVDSSGRVFTRVGVFGPDVTKWRTILVRYGPGGTPVDTVEVPAFDVPIGRIVARREGSTSSSNVPFSPASQWALMPDLRFVSGRTDVYAIHRELSDGRVLRIEREVTPVPVSGAEREEREAAATWAMKRTDPAWRWNGPPIPDVKPYFTSLASDEDGRIWVRLSQAGEVDPEADTVRTDPDARPPTVYRERQVWDIFEPDGRYAGQVEFPFGFTLHAARGEHVWGVQRDELDVQSVVRVRFEPPLGQRPTERPRTASVER